MHARIGLEDLIPAIQLRIQPLLQFLPLRVSPDQLVVLRGLLEELEKRGEMERALRRGEATDGAPDGFLERREGLIDGKKRSEGGLEGAFVQRVDEHFGEAMTQKESSGFVLVAEKNNETASNESLEESGIEQGAAEKPQKNARVDGVLLQFDGELAGWEGDEGVEHREEIDLHGWRVRGENGGDPQRRRTENGNQRIQNGNRRRQHGDLVQHMIQTLHCEDLGEGRGAVLAHVLRNRFIDERFKKRRSRNQKRGKQSFDLSGKHGERQNACSASVFVFARHHFSEERLQNQTHSRHGEVSDCSKEFLKELREERHFGGVADRTVDDSLQQLLQNVQSGSKRTDIARIGEETLASLR